MCQSLHDGLMSSFGGSWPRREPHTRSWLDHPSYNLKLHKRLTYMWGPLIPKGELEFCVHGENWGSFLILCHFNLFFRLWAKPFPKWAYPTLWFMEIAFPLCEKSKKEMCVLPHTHTHKKKNQALHWNNRELSLAFYFSFYLIFS